MKETPLSLSAKRSAIRDPPRRWTRSVAPLLFQTTSAISTRPKHPPSVQRTGAAFATPPNPMAPPIPTPTTARRLESASIRLISIPFTSSLFHSKPDPLRLEHPLYEKRVRRVNEFGRLSPLSGDSFSSNSTSSGRLHEGCTCYALTLHIHVLPAEWSRRAHFFRVRMAGKIPRS